MTAGGAPGALVLAEALSPDEVAPGWTALLIVVALGVAVFLLWRSMNKQLRRVPPTFDPPPDDGGPSSAESSGDGAGNGTGDGPRPPQG